MAKKYAYCREHDGEIFDFHTLDEAIDFARASLLPGYKLESGSGKTGEAIKDDFDIQKDGCRYWTICSNIEVANSCRVVGIITEEDED